MLAALVLASGLVSTPASSAVRPCSAGLVALTFDDGPARVVTPRLVRLLRDRRVPATFFVVGNRVRANPAEARLVARAGVVGNHTWSHARLTRLSDAGIRSELVRTRRQLQRLGIRPSRLMRPPYGATNARVNRVVRGLGLVPVLWTIDTRDWAGGTSTQIANRVLSRLRPHGTNIVLQHDGVRRSPASVEAVPRIVSGARARGYCFATLGDNGRPAPPVPTLGVTVTQGREAGQVPVRLVLHLDEPTSRPVSVRVTTAGATATPGADFTPVDRTVVFPVGVTTMSVTVPVLDDTEPEGLEQLSLRFTRASGLRLGVGTVPAGIVSDDPPPPPSPPPAPAP